MSSSTRGTGADYLVEKSNLSRSRDKLPALTDILIVEDNDLEGDRLTGTLRAMFGYDVDVRRAKTLSSAVDMVLAKVPELILLDDYLLPQDSALNSIPHLRRANFNGPIVIISGMMDKLRRTELMAKGASETIHKDDLNSVAIGNALMALDWNHLQQKTTGG